MKRLLCFALSLVLLLIPAGCTPEDTEKDAKPVIEYMDGWRCDISAARRWEELPAQAQNYVNMIENQIGCRIKYVSVGPERDSIIIR